MEKCARPNCNCVLGETKVEEAGKVYCSQECVDNCTDEVCECKDCSCATAYLIIVRLSRVTMG